MNHVAIIGTGWLGEPLAQQFIKQGCHVLATRRSPARLQPLIKQGINCAEVDLATITPQQLSKLFQQHRIQTVIGCFPPGFRQGRGSDYLPHWQTLSEAASLAHIDKLIMISSTTVYPARAQDMREENASLSLAQTSTDFSAKASTMLKAEQCVIDSGLSYVIIRCSGLIGPERHPARFVAHLKQVSDQAPANMLHLDDAVDITVFAASSLSNEIINATTPDTVSKAQFYRQALLSQQSTVSLPAISNNKDKRILADKLVQLGYSFHYQNTLDTL